ncbi:MAG: hypothetical protein ACUVQX_06360, partial [Candidatus Bathycorpusculaceae bacterium]
LLSPCNVYCGRCAVYKKGKCLGAQKKALKLELMVKFSVIFTYVPKRGNSIHALTVMFTHAKNTIKEYFLRALSNG